MTREEQITYAALDCAKKYSVGDNSICFKAFKKGAEWADQHQPSPWISVEERMPKIDDTVLWYDKDGEYRLGWLENEEHIFFPYESITDFIDNMQYWMPIPELSTTK